MLTLYKTDVSPPARAVMMLIDLLGLEVTHKEVNLPSREHYKPEYLKKNPLHTVPLLEDGELNLADSHAIITYLVCKYGGEKQEELYPSDLGKRAIIDQRLYFDASVLFPRLRTVIYSLARGVQSAPTNQQLEDIEEGYQVMEKYLETTPYVAGERLTLADLSCVSTISSLNCIVEVDSRKYVNLCGWWNRLKQFQWYQNKNVPGLNVFNVFIGGLLGRRF